MSESDADNGWEEGIPSVDKYSKPKWIDALRNDYRQRAVTSMNDRMLGDDDRKYILAQRAWYATASAEEKNRFVAEQLRSMCADEHHIDPNRLTLLAVLYSVDKEPFWHNQHHRFIEDMEPDGGLGLNNDQAASMIGYLGQLEKHTDSAEHRFQLHVILDYLADVMQSMQGHENEVTKNYPGYYPSIPTFHRLAETAEHYAKHATNYLIGRKFRDMVELSKQDILDKPDALHGGSGGSTDATIYAFKNTLKNYGLRTRYGVYEGYANRHPLLHIAPGFLAMYDNNNIAKVFAIPPDAEDRRAYVRDRIMRAGTQNYEDLYAQLNIPQDEWATRKRGLRKLQDIWDCKNSLADSGTGFLVDMDRIDPTALHPYVLGTLVYENVETLKKHAHPSDVQLQEIREDTLLHKLYPEGASAVEAYTWKNLASLSVRKKIEDDFGLDIADYDFWIQRAWLEYLDEMKTEDADQLKAYLQTGQQRPRLIALSGARFQKGLDVQLLAAGASPETEPAIAAYATLVEQAEKGATELERMYRKAAPNGTTPRSAFFQVLIRQANIYLSNFFPTLQKMQNIADEEERQRHIADAVENFVASLKKQDKHIRQTKDLVSALPRGELTQLNLKELETVQLQGPVSVEQLRTDPHLERLRMRVIEVISKQFIDNDDKIFEEEFLKTEGAIFFYSTVGKQEQLMAFLGAEPMHNGYTYIDWLNADPKTPVRGLTQATVMTALKGIEQHRHLYNVAKPHVGSFPFAIEEFGSVCFGATDDDEYQHHYLRCRKNNTEDGYTGKTLTAEQIEHLKNLCTHKNTLHDTEIDGTPLKVCTVEFIKTKHKHDISAQDEEDGFIFRTVRELCGEQGYVLSRYIPINTTLVHRTYLCVFEPSLLPEEEQRKLNETLKSFHKKREH